MRSQSRANIGFTLIELILVLAIIAISASVVMLAIGNDSERLEVEQEIRLISDRFAATQVRAQALGMEVGFFAGEDQYYFVAISEWQDNEAGQKIPIFEQPERRFRRLPMQQLGAPLSTEQPLAIIFADGLYAPEFELRYQLSDEASLAILVADGVNPPRLRWEFE